ncbi:hypothetical protein BSKO_01653 [Bryopsis sp. KO-2023]|nr:hypothetical protein BSKO_01653 [Bryopsis sp. KO-2023]
MSYTYNYPRPAVTVDTIVLSKRSAEKPSHLLLIQRKHPPCQDQWALPGGFVDEGEPLDAAAARELQEETSVDPASVDLIQVGSYGDPGRDPRGWTITVAYAAIVPSMDLGVKAADDARAAQWFDVRSLPPLAFDHKVIVRDALTKYIPTLSDGEMVDEFKKGVESLQGPWIRPTM